MTMLSQNSINSVLSFLSQADILKRIRRSGYVSKSLEHESVSAHCWHLCLFAITIHPLLEFECDLGRVLELLTVQELATIELDGNLPHGKENSQATNTNKVQDASELFSHLPDPVSSRLLLRWLEVENGTTPEARFARALDRLQTLAQNVAAGGRFWKEARLSENQIRETYAPIIAECPILKPLFDALYETARKEKLWENE